MNVGIFIIKCVYCMVYGAQTLSNSNCTLEYLVLRICFDPSRDLLSECKLKRAIT